MLLCEPQEFERVKYCHSVREAVLRSDQYLLLYGIQLAKSEELDRRPRRVCRAALGTETVKSSFVEAFCEHADCNGNGAMGSLDEKWARTVAAMRAAEAVLPNRRRTPNKPWISESTMGLIDQRSAARECDDLPGERRLHKEIRAAAKKDRTEWVEQMLSSGTWDQVKRLRQKSVHRPGKLRDQSGGLVDSDAWAETMAQHLASIQWCVRPTGLVDGPVLGPVLPVCVGDLSRPEVELVVKKLWRKVGPRRYTSRILASTSRRRAWPTMGDRSL